MTLRKKIGLLLFSIGICFLLGDSYFLYEKISRTQTAIAVAHKEYQKPSTSSIYHASYTRYGWFLMMGLASLAVGSYFSRSHKSNVPRITLDFRNKKNLYPYNKKS